MGIADDTGSYPPAGGNSPKSSIKKTARLGFAVLCAVVLCAVEIRALIKPCSCPRVASRARTTPEKNVEFMTPSFQQYVSLHHFHALRPTVGTALRIAVDIGSIWVAFLASWVLIDNAIGGAVRPGSRRHNSTGRAVFVPGLPGLHRCGPLHVTHNYRLAVKLGRVFWINLILGVIAIAVLSFSEQPSALSARACSRPS